MKTVTLPQGTIAYREEGTGAPVVFVHGLLTNAALWRHEVPQLAAAGLRCIVPTWPLGAHDLPMRPDADLDPPGVATLISAFLDALDLHDVTLVANDTGGAFVQVLMARMPERVGRVVLVSCDTLEVFFPQPFKLLADLARLPGTTWLIAQATRLRVLHRLPLVFGLVAKRPLPDAIADSYLTPMRRSRAIRRDLGKVLRGAHRRHTLAAFERFEDFDRPVLLIWAQEERLFPLSLAHRLAGRLPDARLELVTDSYTFVPEDRPGVVAGLVRKFALPD
ncbi:alpha/beta fold hydrolase [Planomonospora sp. ID67723]|uniref:alpha/beta fold hydrolase n=1 Tax=Planomonospora sp. ID67723 TaxID=2738134 RepID=UPI001E5063CB|nr:alpha/beta fold hydrolase [Planomonospora sp. ID67723]